MFKTANRDGGGRAWPVALILCCLGMSACGGTTVKVAAASASLANEEKTQLESPPEDAVAAVDVSDASGVAFHRVYVNAPGSGGFTWWSDLKQSGDTRPGYRIDLYLKGDATQSGNNKLMVILWPMEDGRYEVNTVLVIDGSIVWLANAITTDLEIDKDARVVLWRWAGKTNPLASGDTVPFSGKLVARIALKGEAPKPAPAAAASSEGISIVSCDTAKMKDGRVLNLSCTIPGQTQQPSGGSQSWGGTECVNFTCANGCISSVTAGTTVGNECH